MRFFQPSAYLPILFSWHEVSLGSVDNIWKMYPWMKWHTVVKVSTYTVPLVAVIWNGRIESKWSSCIGKSHLIGRNWGDLSVPVEGPIEALPQLTITTRRRLYMKCGNFGQPNILPRLEKCREVEVAAQLAQFVWLAMKRCTIRWFKISASIDSTLQTTTSMFVATALSLTWIAVDIHFKGSARVLVWIALAIGWYFY